MSFGTTSYSNWIGTGIRDWLIVVTSDANINNAPLSNMVNGVKSTGNSGGNFANAAETGKQFKFQFPFAVLMDEFTLTQDSSGSQGTFTLGGSNDDVTYDTLATGINLGGASAVDVHAFTNTKAYVYYRLLSTAGTLNINRWMEEFEFKVAIDSAFGTGAALGATSYSNQDGSGNRTARMFISLNHATACNGTPSGSPVGYMGGLLDGDTTTTGCVNATAFASGISDAVISLGFRQPVLIDEFTLYQQTSASHGTFTLRGSLDNVSFTDIKTGLTLGGATAAVCSLGAVTQGYNFYQLVQTSGSLNTGPWVFELQFKTSLLSSSAGGAGGHGGANQTRSRSRGRGR